eukprot:TRINITY_DN670_c0_g2_i8.p3 TRINITY_DN670_c0_g2~~TRINITY_DN670_c0_g2_i8.p3  ORF type:complete len:150 (+),score=48.19 TRINITY_DN670_c0_g2_i8:25-450(+)
MIRRPPRSTRKESSAASDVYKRQVHGKMIKAKSSSLEDDLTIDRPRSVSDYFCMEDRNSRFRSYMEDRTLPLTLGYKCIDKYGGFARQGYFAVFDGHGGEAVAEYCASRLHDILLKTLKKDSWKGLQQSLDETFTKVPPCN